jgi:hypothetical protein
MTAKMVYHAFPLDVHLKERRFFAVLLFDVILETRNEGFDRLYSAGIYSFATKDSRNVFTKVCNADKDINVAYKINRKTDEKD